MWRLTERWSEGGWIPWSMLAFGLAVFGVATGVVIYLRGTTIAIDVQTPDVEVAVKGSTITIIDPKRETVKVEPGEQELTIRHGDLEAKASCSNAGREKPRPADPNRPALLKSPFDGATAKNGQDRWADFLRCFSDRRTSPA